MAEQIIGHEPYKSPFSEDEMSVRQNSVAYILRKMARARSLTDLAEMWDGFGDAYKRDPEVMAAKFAREKKLKGKGDG